MVEHRFDPFNVSLALPRVFSRRIFDDRKRILLYHLNELVESGNTVGVCDIQWQRSSSYQQLFPNNTEMQHNLESLTQQVVLEIEPEAKNGAIR